MEGIEEPFHLKVLGSERCRQSLVYLIKCYMQRVLMQTNWDATGPRRPEGSQRLRRMLNIQWKGRWDRFRNFISERPFLISILPALFTCSRSKPSWLPPRVAQRKHHDHKWRPAPALPLQFSSEIGSIALLLLEIKSLHVGVLAPRAACVNWRWFEGSGGRDLGTWKGRVTILIDCTFLGGLVLSVQLPLPVAALQAKTCLSLKIAWKLWNYVQRRLSYSSTYIVKHQQREGAPNVQSPWDA